MGIMYLIGTFAVPIMLALVIYRILAIILGQTLIFSKVTVSLLIALLINRATPFVDGGGFLSYLKWLAIVLAITFLLCRLPRISCSYQFFCNYFISSVIIEIICSLVFSIFFDDYEITLLSEIIKKIVCFALSCKLVMEQMQAFGTNVISNRILIIIDRCVASVVYAVAMVAQIAMNSLWEVNLFTAIILFVVTFALTFVCDVHYFVKLQYIVKRNISVTDIFKEMDDNGSDDWLEEIHRMEEEQRNQEWEDHLECEREMEWEREREEQARYDEWEDHYYDYD